MVENEDAKKKEDDKKAIEKQPEQTNWSVMLFVIGILLGGGYYLFDKNSNEISAIYGWENKDGDKEIVIDMNKLREDSLMNDSAPIPSKLKNLNIQYEQLKSATNKAKQE